MGFYLKRFYRKVILNDLKDDIIISVPSNATGGSIFTSDYIEASRAKRIGYITLGIFVFLVLTLFGLSLYDYVNNRFLKDANQYGYNWWKSLMLIISSTILLWFWVSSFNGLRWMLRKFRT
jgi:hypothetical protein